MRDSSCCLTKIPPERQVVRETDRRRRVASQSRSAIARGFPAIGNNDFMMFAVTRGRADRTAEFSLLQAVKRDNERTADLGPAGSPVKRAPQSLTCARRDSPRKGKPMRGDGARVRCSAPAAVTGGTRAVGRGGAGPRLACQAFTGETRAIGASRRRARLYVRRMAYRLLCSLRGQRWPRRIA